MGKYTTEVRFICECATELNESTGGKNVRDICYNAAPMIFDDNLELFDENYKSVLFPKILMHYYTREIAFETVGLWILKLNTKLQEILPYYNQLYKSETLKFDPLHTFNLAKSHVEQGVDNNETVGNNSGVTYNAYSDTPNGALVGVQSDTYLSSASKNTNTAQNSGSYDGKDSRFWQEFVKGNGGESYSKLLMEYRKTMLNIDMQIIDELGDLFFKLW